MKFSTYDIASTSSCRGRLLPIVSAGSRARRPRHALPTLLVLLAVVGCQQSNSSTTAAPSANPNYIINGATPFTPLPPTAQVLKVSRLPINYMVSPGGLLRVRDLTAGTELAVDFVLSATVVRIDADFGIYFGNAQTYTKKLDPNHRYQLSLDPTVHQTPAK
jgi:hypothetical protein